MFTGIIRHRGTLEAFRPGRPSQVVVACDTLAAETVRRGDSVAVNGCCLTAVDFGPGTFTFDVSEETRAVTTLETLARGARVNIEPALRAGDPIGGHFVTGHVDGVAAFAARSPENVFAFRAPAALLHGLVRKGSVAVDGVSLTVSDLDADRFEVAVIPATLADTNLGALAPGDRVNVETDLLGKYVLKALGRAGGAGDLSLDKLREYGFA